MHWDPVGLVEWDQSQGPPDSKDRVSGTWDGGGELVVVGAAREEDMGTACAIAEPSSSWSHAEPEQGALHSTS